MNIGKLLSMSTKPITDFFKRKNSTTLVHASTSNLEVSTAFSQDETEKLPTKFSRVEPKESNVTSLERDPGLRRQISEYHANQQDEIRRAYLQLGPYQIIMDYPWSDAIHRRRFQESWFKVYNWLEYSPSKDAAFCLPCFLFFNKNTGRCGENAFTIEGFRSWRKVRNGKKCSFLIHVGEPCSPHNNAVRSCDNLMNQSRHIDKVINRQSVEEIEKNRMRLNTSIQSVRFLAMQGCAFRGHNECEDSTNRGNFIEFIKSLGEYNEKIGEITLEHAPRNAKYTSPQIQKEILNIFANKVRNKIREEIGQSKYCILVDEARDDSRKEQMALVLRFVDANGFIRERFFEIVSVEDTCASTLKKELSFVLSRYKLDICNIRGQGYDGASNMRGQWNGLQALFLNDCPYAYYIHCFAHRLQLALVGAAKNVPRVHKFFLMLNFVINVVGTSTKRNGEFQLAQENENEFMIEIGELETGTGANQLGTLQRAGDTRWSSHYSSVSSLIKHFGPTCVVLENIQKDGASPNIKGDALTAYEAITSFEFVFTLHLMKELMGITDILCQALQKKSQDIVNAMDLVSSTKTIIQKMRDNSWEILLDGVKMFCQKHDIATPNMQDAHVVGRGRHQQSHVTIAHHYQFDIFNVTLDTQLSALNERFNEKAMELLILSSALEPKDGYKSFKIDEICNLVDKFYPQDFTEQEREILTFQLKLYQEDVPHHPHLKNLSTLSELCRGLAETKKSQIYYLVDRLIRLVLTLPVSTATTERAFSAMKIVKTRLRNKMDDDFLGDCLSIYIEREIAMSISNASIIDDFYAKKDRRAQL